MLKLKSYFKFGKTFDVKERVSVDVDWREYRRRPSPGNGVRYTGNYLCVRADGLLQGECSGQGPKPRCGCHLSKDEMEPKSDDVAHIHPMTNVLQRSIQRKIRMTTLYELVYLYGESSDDFERMATAVFTATALDPMITDYVRMFHKTTLPLMVRALEAGRTLIDGELARDIQSADGCAWDDCNNVKPSREALETGGKWSFSR